MIEYDALLRVVLIGDGNAGKTTLMYRITQDIFHKTLDCIGPDFKIKTYQIQNRKLRVRVWDTDSLSRFRNVKVNHFRNADIAFACFNLNDNYSFDAVEYWGKQYQKQDEKIPFIVLGCKKDLSIQVPRDRIERFLQTYKLLYFEISAKTGESVQQTILPLIRQEGIKKLTRMELQRKIAQNQSKSQPRKCILI